MEPKHPQVSVTEAFSQVPRELFLPREERGSASSNVPLPIGHGQTNSQPSTVADMLELLDPQLGDRVLDVGSGSGWTTALLGVLVGPNGHVTGVERHEKLIERAQKSLSLARADNGDVDRVEIRTATAGVLGLPDEAPFDRILVSAGAEMLPRELVDQLAQGGVMVIPVQGEMLKVQRSNAEVDGVTITRHGRYRFVPLVRD
ncbi:protein-L-isoaspartate O-methyltransferase [Brevibacterium aurantiacum]|uniref:Protein-L-isoaspartate O-methyltransferase n=1 Tax=Brevibacterium aurantiacum TaxID=273384 RepID=A0A556CEY0_BREAU|nr:methyltransferase domain-containing protein [Brevibacterium aurantiacum]TSI15982.1 methyltransferase domain-containing protein [Brevibacterium aurantiacum]